MISSWDPINIVVPMAGRGSRFAHAGFETPKPLIPIHGKPMIELVVNNVRPSHPHHFIFICLEEHLHELPVAATLRALAPNCHIIPVKEVTEGAACTILLAKSRINNDRPLMIVNSDQWVDYRIDHYLSTMRDKDVDGLIMTMPESDPKWSYVKMDEKGNVIGVFEKQVVSREATVGIYNFRRGLDFVKGAESMIALNKRVNGEFYVAPVYNELIDLGATIRCHNIQQKMHGLGIPNDLENFIKSPASRKAITACQP